MYRENAVYMGSNTLRGFRPLLGSWDIYPMVGGQLYRNQEM
jgi:hypothetical protein